MIFEWYLVTLSALNRFSDVSKKRRRFWVKHVIFIKGYRTIMYRRKYDTVFVSLSHHRVNVKSDSKFSRFVFHPSISAPIRFSRKTILSVRRAFSRSCFCFYCTIRIYKLSVPRGRKRVEFVDGRHT